MQVSGASCTSATPNRGTLKAADDGIKIASAQGHSLRIENTTGEVPLTKDIFPSDFLVHATTCAAWERIRTVGLKPGRRVDLEANTFCHQVT